MATKSGLFLPETPFTLSLTTPRFSLRVFAWSESCEFQTQISTGIESVMGDETQDTAIYDMMGRKVVNPTSGVYIKNGKKCIIKVE